MQSSRGSAAMVDNTQRRTPVRVIRSAKRWLCSIAAAAALFGAGNAFAQAPSGNQFFDWNLTSAAQPNPSGYIPAPFLNNSNVTDVRTYLTQAQAANVPLAVKVTQPLSASAAQIFKDFPVKYVFADFEPAPDRPGYTNDVVANTTALVQQVRTSGTSANAFVGNFNLSTLAGDPTMKSNPTTGVDPRVGPYAIQSYTLDQYRSTGVNMANEQLYPGQSDWRSPANTPPDSTAPNLRSSFFTLPIERLSFVSNNVAPGNQHIPYVARFNNWGNPALDSDANPANGFAFNNPTHDQLLSRNDFSALMLHYRMRGAGGFHLLEPGVIGYTQQQFEQDAANGWNLAAANGAGGFGGANATPLTFGTAIQVLSDPLNPASAVSETFEQAGVAYSGVTNGSNAADPSKMTILLSNLSQTDRTVLLPSRIAGGVLANNSVAIAAGSHRLLQFTKSGSTWNLDSNSSVFDDPALNSRDGVGVPEPASISLLSLAGVGVLVRRRRRN
jgi:hypothetical protein